MLDQATVIEHRLDKLEEDLKAARKRVTFEKDPKKAKVLQVKRDEAAAAVAALKLNYDTTIYHMPVTIAHELCHLFTGFLNGTDRPRTPPDVTAAGHEPGAGIGEHGWAWECGTFGRGAYFFVQDQWKNASVDDQKLQAGTPWAYDYYVEDQVTTWWRMKPEFVSSMINLGKSTFAHMYLYGITTDVKMILRLLQMRQE